MIATQMQAGQSDIVTLDDLGRRLSLSPRTLKRLTRDEGLPTFRLTAHGPLFAFWSEIEAWIKRQRAPQRPSAGPPRLASPRPPRRGRQ